MIVSFISAIKTMTAGGSGGSWEIQFTVQTVQTESAQLGALTRPQTKPKSRSRGLDWTKPEPRVWFGSSWF